MTTAQGHVTVSGDESAIRQVTCQVFWGMKVVDW